MEFDIEFSKNAVIKRVALTCPIDRLWLCAEGKEEFVALVCLFNPNNQLCGSISFGMSKFINEIYISDTVCTMNGLRHKLLEGTYTIVVLPLSVEETAKVNIRIETNIEKSYDQRYLQDQKYLQDERYLQDENFLQDVKYLQDERYLQEEKKIYEEKKEITCFDNLIDDTNRYYKGDFHGHTIFSDGHLTIQEAMEVLQKNNMDFMSFTEHNTMPFDLPKLPCLSVPSIELTLPIGHMNIHGVKDLGVLLQQYQKLSDEKSIWDCAVQVFKEECNLSLNHMFMNPWHFSYDEFDLSQLNTIEVICDPTYPTAARANDQAVRFMDFLWQEGLTIYGIGGSDSHNKLDELYEGAKEPSMFGDPATYVYCEGLSVNNIIDGVKKGHTYVTRYGKLNIQINEGKYLPGDQIPKDEKVISYRIDLDNIPEPCIGRIILNGETVEELIFDDQNMELCYTFDLKERPWWLRFGLYDQSGHVIAYVNPIYQGTHQCRNTIFKDLYQKFLGIEQSMNL